MKLVDITTKAQFDDAIETAMALATGHLSDHEIISAMRDAATSAGEYLAEHSVAVMTEVEDASCYDSAGKAKMMFMLLAAYGKQIMPLPRVMGLFDQKADEYEEESR